MPHLLVHWAVRHQFCVSALLDNFSVTDDVNLVNVDNAAESMGAVDYCFRFHYLVELFSDFFFRLWVQTGCRFIEKENFSLFF